MQLNFYRTFISSKNIFSNIICSLYLILMGIGAIKANNISISNAQLINNNSTEGFVMVEFDITWANSWRTENLNGDGVTNWDAAWLFIKYKNNLGQWQHAYLNNTGHFNPVGSQIETGLLNPSNPFSNNNNQGLGVFIYRSEIGSGTFSMTGVKLRWNYNANSISNIDEILDVKILGLEMVYVPEGSYFLGSGGTEYGRLYVYPNQSQAYHVTSEEGIITSSQTGNLWGSGGTTSTTMAVSPADPHMIPAAFPKGFNAFYCMKHEISQQAYVEFLNMLNRTQQSSRFSSNTVGNYLFYQANRIVPASRCGVKLMSDSGGNEPRIYGCDLNNNNISGEEGDGMYYGLNNMSWGDLCAYLDWSGLRPMTELEFEKANRGFAQAVPNEFAWGNNTVKANVVSNVNESNFYITSNNGKIDEYIVNPDSGDVGNAIYLFTMLTYNFDQFDPLNGMSRVGVFATDSSTRINAGATYFGILDMCSGQWERCVSIGNATGRQFTGLHGNGSLSAQGVHDVTGWPGQNATGSGMRGGSWGTEREQIRMSDRAQGSNGQSHRGSLYGGRGVRSIP
jgi:formylglycine-generating enzyme required for sulfatase activity